MAEDVKRRDESRLNPYAPSLAEQGVDVNATDGNFPIRTEGRLTLQQYRQAVWLCHGRRNLLIAVPLLCIVIAALALPATDVPLLIRGSVITAIALGGIYVFAKERAGEKKQCLAGTGHFGLQVCQFGLDHVACSCGEATAVWAWDEFERAISVDSMFVLTFTNKPRFVPIPRTFLLSEQDWQNLVDLVHRRL